MNRLILILTLVFLACVGLCPAQDAPTVTASLSVDRDHIFQWEPFTLTLTMRNTGVSLAPDAPLSALAPEGNLEIIDSIQELQKKQVVVNRQTHTVRRFRFHARALAPGKITLAPVIEAQQVTRLRSFFGWDYRHTPYPIRVAPLTITAQPIPDAGRPDSFSGAIGRLSFAVDVAPTELAVGDLITATLRVNGQGYLDGMQPPSISPGRNFRAYDPKLKESGPDLRVFEQTIVPQSSNAVEIAAVSLCFFDTGARQYRTISRGPFRLTFRAAQEVTDDPYIPTGTAPGTAGPDRTQTATDLSAFAAAQQSRSLVTALILSLLCAIIAGLWLAVRLKRRSLALLLYVVIGVQLLALCHTARQSILTRSAGLISEGAVARIAPAGTALATFDLPKGSAVILLESHADWRKIEFKNKRGWIESHSCLNHE